MFNFCSCDYEPSDESARWFEDAPASAVYPHGRGRRCKCCDNVVRRGDEAYSVDMFRSLTEWEMDRGIKGSGDAGYGGDEYSTHAYTAWLCEECGDLFASLREAGFCPAIGKGLKKDWLEYVRAKAAATL